MVKKLGVVVKSDVCHNCFTTFEWDDPADELTMNGNRYVICPECGSRVRIDDIDSNTYFNWETKEPDDLGD